MSKIIRGDVITFEFIKYKRRTFWQWIIHKPRERIIDPIRQFVVTGVNKTQHLK